MGVRPETHTMEYFFILTGQWQPDPQTTRTQTTAGVVWSIPGETYEDRFYAATAEFRKMNDLAPSTGIVILFITIASNQSEA